MGRKFGFSFSWKRALGISAAKGRISRKIGIPLTRSGRQRKAGRLLGDLVGTAIIGTAETLDASRPSPAIAPQQYDYKSIMRDLKLGDKEINGTLFGRGVCISGLMRKTTPKNNRLLLSDGRGLLIECWNGYVFNVGAKFVWHNAIQDLAHEIATLLSITDDITWEPDGAGVWKRGDEVVAIGLENGIASVVKVSPSVMAEMEPTTDSSPIVAPSTLIAASHTSSHTNANEPTPDYSVALNLVRQVRNEISSGEGFAPGSILGQGLLEHGGRRCYTCNLVFGRDIRRCGKCGSGLN
jgi:hypothetical protein